MENGSLRLAESIFSLIENFDNVMHNNHIQFNKSYKTVVLFKLNNADFLPLFFPAFFKSFNLLFLCVYRMPLHIILFLIMPVYHLSIFLILRINLFLWFLMLYVYVFFKTKRKFYLNHLCLILLLMFQKNIIIILFAILPCCFNMYVLHL